VIDLHSHVLPGLDDGARDIEESLEMARAAAADGTIVLAATPHVREDYPTPAAAMERAVADLRARLDAAGIQLQIVTGGELAIEQLTRLPQGELGRFGLAGNPHYVLLEFPYHGWPLELDQRVFQHAERHQIEIVGRLVEHQEVRRAGEFAGEQEARALAARERADWRLGQRWVEQIVLEIALDVLLVAAHLDPVAAMGELKPEVIDHLMVAGREFLLAVRALIDSRLESMTPPEPGEQRVERIPIA